MQLHSPDHNSTILKLGNVSVPLPPHRFHHHHNQNYGDDLSDYHHEYDGDDRRSLGQLSGGKRSLESEQTAVSQVVLVVTWSNFCF